MNEENMNILLSIYGQTNSTSNSKIIDYFYFLNQFDFIRK